MHGHRSSHDTRQGSLIIFHLRYENIFISIVILFLLYFQQSFFCLRLHNLFLFYTFFMYFYFKFVNAVVVLCFKQFTRILHPARGKILCPHDFSENGDGFSKDQIAQNPPKVSPLFY